MSSVLVVTRRYIVGESRNAFRLSPVPFVSIFIEDVEVQPRKYCCSIAFRCQVPGRLIGVRLLAKSAGRP